MTKTFTSLAGFAAFLGELAAELHTVEHAALDRAGKIVEDEARTTLGTYRYDWPQLAESTQARRAAMGYAANEPGLVTGEMRDSIGHHVVSHEEVQIGSDSDKLVWFELGTSRQPPRPVLAGALAHRAKEVAEVIGHDVVGYLATGDKPMGHGAAPNATCTKIV